MHVGQTEIPPGISVRQLLVVEPQAMQHRRMQIVRTHRIHRSLEAEFVRGPEPYKGKGVKYAEERIVRKEGKKK